MSKITRISKINIKDASKHHKYKFENIYVYTPYQIYESQNIFIDYIIKCLNQQKNALIQSPTGTGKTMSLLCSTIAWAMNQQQSFNKQPPQIIYASRTHAQLKQVVSQINKLCYQVKLSILSSRDQTCANEQLKLLKGQDKELQCRLRIAQKKGLSCKFYQNQSYYQKQAQLGKLMDLEEIMLKGKLEGFCPFFYERFSKAIANIVLIPYNYLFDRKVWINDEGSRLQGSILILDQAHNIQSACEQFRQYSLHLSTLTRATQQFQDLRIEKLNQNKNKIDPSALDKNKMLKITIEDIEINATYIEQIYQYLQTLDIPADSSGIMMDIKNFLGILDKATRKEKFGSILQQIAQVTARFKDIRTDLLYYPYWALEGWMKFVQKIQQLHRETENIEIIDQFKAQLLYEGADIKINIYCLDPSNGFKDVIQQHKPRSIILTSGTLSPLKVWPLELKVDFAQPVSCPHVLSPQQTQTIVLGIGRSGTNLDTRFENRKNPRLYEDIGHAIYDIIKSTPNGVVALFPSYSFLEQTKNHLTTLKIMTKIYTQKNIYFERKDNSDFTSVLDRYMKDAQTEKGALLFALIRGKISQGLDFSHKKCRAVVLIGVPYPCSKDVKIVAKMNYMNSLADKGKNSTLNGTQWYLAETIRAINQGIGRLIRTPDDFGTVYLLDSRFGRQDIEAQIASWARMNLIKPNTYDQFVQKIKQINRIKQLSPKQTEIHKQLGLVSVRGQTLNSEDMIIPVKSIRQSISRPVNIISQKQQREQKNKKLTLQEMMNQIKAEKQLNQLEKKQKETEHAEIVDRQEKNKISYQRKLFMNGRKVVKAIENARQPCPICQIQSTMVKSNTCQHAMCQDCWDKWLQQDLRCPICRGRVRKNFLIAQKE